MEKDTGIHGPPLFRFGLVADVQYADREPDKDEKAIYYREAIPTLRKAIDAFGQHKDIRKVVHLGDIIDGNVTAEKTQQDFDDVLEAFEEFDRQGIQVCHVLGNHCFRVRRDLLLERLGLEQQPYYAMQLHEGWRLIVLDTTDLSLCAWPEGSSEYQEALKYAEDRPLEDHPEMVSWNGGLREAQLDWLKAQLRDAENAGEKCIVCSHHPLATGCARPTHMCWNGQEVSDILASSPSVVGAFHGHDHQGGYAEYNGKHFTTVEAIVECPPDSVAYGIVDVYPSSLVIRGAGRVTSRKLNFA